MSSLIDRLKSIPMGPSITATHARVMSDVYKDPAVSYAQGRAAKAAVNAVISRYVGSPGTITSKVVGTVAGAAAGAEKARTAAKAAFEASTTVSRVGAQATIERAATTGLVKGALKGAGIMAAATMAGDAVTAVIAYDKEYTSTMERIRAGQANRTNGNVTETAF